MQPYLHLLQMTWKYADGRRAIFVLTYALFVVANVIGMLEPLVLARIGNVLQLGGDGVFQQVTWLLVLYASMTLFFWIFHGPARNMERLTSFHIRKRFVESMYQIITSLPMRWHRDHHTGETYDKITKAQRGLGDFSGYAARHVESAIHFSMAFVMILIYLPYYGLVAVLLATVAMIIMLRLDKSLAKWIAQANEQEHRVTASLFDYVSNITTVITLRLESLTSKELTRRIMRVFPFYRKEVMVNEWKYFVVNVFMTLIRFSVMFLFVYDRLQTDGVVLIGSLLAVYQYAERLTWGYFNFAVLHEEVVTQSTNLRSIDSIFAADAKFNAPSGKIVKNVNTWKKIEIHNLWFHYEDDEREVHHIDGVNLSIVAGKNIALVGASGSGKSTLMNVLRGTEPADKVDLSIDGKTYAGLAALSRTTTLMPQDPEIFENTIEYNITAGIAHNKNIVKSACDVAFFTPVVKRLPKGLQSSIKEKGVNLSGGEKQRLALARGVFAAQDSTIILMDEPTSSVDAATEMEIYKRLFKRFAKQTIISSVHRLHLLPFFDEIYVLEKGKIIQHGTFNDLTAKHGPLQKLWENYTMTMREEG